MRFATGFFIIALIISLSTPTLAYKETSVSNGGTISGKVILAGKEPPPLSLFHSSSITTPNFADAFRPAQAGAY